MSEDESDSLKHTHTLPSWFSIMVFHHGFPSRLSHHDFPITTFPSRLSHHDFPITTFPSRLSHHDFPITTFPSRLSLMAFSHNYSVTTFATSTKTLSLHNHKLQDRTNPQWHLQFPTTSPISSQTPHIASQHLNLKITHEK
jgi:hypothetical protein